MLDPYVRQPMTHDGKGHYSLRFKVWRVVSGACVCVQQFCKACMHVQHAWQPPAVAA
jgi:hypothetical protein